MKLYQKLLLPIVKLLNKLLYLILNKKNKYKRGVDDER